MKIFYGYAGPRVNKNTHTLMNSFIDGFNKITKVRKYLMQSFMRKISSIAQAVTDAYMVKEPVS